MTKWALCLMGPTGVGKTQFACEWVQRFPFEIISIDSAMIYRGMNIGTAKPDAHTLSQAPHHLIDICDPTAHYSVGMCCTDVSRWCETIGARGKIPLLVGGSMMYFHALQQGLSTLPPSDDKLRAEMTSLAVARGWAWMHAELTRIDPVTAMRLHPHDTQRVQRALEVYQLTQTPFSVWLARHKNSPTFHFENISLMPNSRSWLHARIEARFTSMLADGLVDEVQTLLAQWPLTSEHPSMRCVGYRQTFECLTGASSWTQLPEKGTAATRQLAKRQLTWLRNSISSQMFAPDCPQSVGKMVVLVEKMLDNFGECC